MSIVSTTPKASIEYDRIIPGEQDDGTRCEVETPPLSKQTEVITDRVNERRYGDDEQPEQRDANLNGAVYAGRWRMDG